MSVYRPKGPDGKPKTPFYHYDFIVTVGGERRRVHGSTGERTAARAKKVEEATRRRIIDGKPHDGITLAAACLRYCDEVAADQASASDTEKAFEHCCRLIGSERLLVNITTADISEAAHRRACETYGKRNPRLVSKATVNRQIIEPMRRLLWRAKRSWGVSVDPSEIHWREILLREPIERVRELSGEEADAFWSELRPDYHPLLWFLANRGFRVRSVLGMKKADVDMNRSAVCIHIKGRGRTWQPIAPEQAAVLQTEMMRSPLSVVWTYEVQRGDMAGMRRPITYNGLRRTMQTTLKRAGVSDFRIHDLRHDFASKLLRATRDLALVKKALAHADISSTVRYAHVLDEDVITGLQALSRNSPGIAPQTAAKKVEK